MCAPPLQGKFLNVIVSGLGAVWWTISAALVTHKVGGAPSNDGLAGWRTATVALFWTEAGLFGLQTAAGMVWACRSGAWRDYESMDV